MVGGNEFEKINGRKKGKPEDGRSKDRKVRRGGKRVVPHAGDEPAPFDIPPAPDGKITEETSKNTIKDDPAPTVESGKSRKQETPLDPAECLRQIERKKNELLGRIRKGKISEEEEEDPELIHVVFPRADMLRFGKLTQEEQDMLWDAQHKANDEIDSALEGRIEKNKMLATEEKRRGQLINDEFESGSKTSNPESKFYVNGSIPHDANEASRKRPERKGAPEAEKELDPEELKEVIDDIEGAWKDLAGIYQEDEEDKILILKGKIAGYGKRQLVNIFGVSKKQADKIAREAIDKIMSK